jgi:hypothetical protein
MRRHVSILTLMVLACMSVWSLTAVHVVHVQQFCAGINERRILFTAPDSHNLALGPGVYMASSYTLANGFGLRGVTHTSIVVPRLASPP